MRYRVASSTDAGRVRPQNEDSVLIAMPLVAVADGMGGANAGEVASGLAVKTLGEWKDTPDASPGSLREAVLEAHRTILRRARDDKSLEGMGTTLTAAWLDGSRATLAHVGDSRAYLLRGDVIERLTEDHTLVQQWVQEGRLSQEEADSGHPMRHLLRQALGAQSDVDVSILSLDLRAGDRLLISSDGLHGQAGITDARIREVLQSSTDPETACGTLVREANEAGGDDNISVVLVEALASEAAGNGGAPTETDAPVIVSKPSSGRHRTPGSGRSVASRLRIGAAVAVALAVVLGLAFLMTRPDDELLVASVGGRVAIIEGTPGAGGASATGRVVETTDVAVDALPVTFRRRVEEGIVVSSLDEARQRVRDLPRILGPTETPVPTPPLTPVPTEPPTPPPPPPPTPPPA